MKKALLSISLFFISHICMSQLSISCGGTNATTSNAALNNLLPSQSGNGGKFLKTDGSNAAWDTVSGGGGGSGCADCWMYNGNSVSSEKWFGTSTNYDIPFRVNNVEALRIKNNGNVGIGVTSPNNIFQVKDYINFNTAKQSTYVGYKNGEDVTTGMNNNLFGYVCGINITTGEGNTAVGTSALLTLTTGSQNTAIGNEALRSIVGGNDNVAVGYDNMIFVTGGTGNTSVGTGSMRDVTTSVTANTLFGYNCMQTSTGASYNSAFGGYSLWKNTGGSNLAAGYLSGYQNTTGTQNTFLGYYSGGLTTTGSNNILIGHYAGNHLTTENKYFIVNSIDREDKGSDLTKSILVGVQDADSSQQSLRVNAKIHFGNNSNTGSQTATLGTNSPANASNLTPYTWINVIAPDGTLCTMPIWKK